MVGLVRYLLLGCAVFLLGTSLSSADDGRTLERLERSFWLHASLATVPQRGYWGRKFPVCDTPSAQEIQNAAKLLTGKYGANRLYLIYHHEISLENIERSFKLWRQYCPSQVELIPTLLLRMYDKQKSVVFSAEELRRLVGSLKRTVNPARVAVYDVYPNRDQGASLDFLATQYPRGLIRVGIQPAEKVKQPFVSAVQDTWSGFCHGKTNADWLARGFGAETLEKWVQQRNQNDRSIVWNLIVVAWDYSATKRGGYPGYDDAAKNMPLAAGRNFLAVKKLLQQSKAKHLAGFSSDLFILQVNSQNKAHDGLRGSIYETLKRGEMYRGYYSTPFQEVTTIFIGLKNGKVKALAPK